ncbi:MAG: AbrB family transcriptional regulator [Deltaproteobacteria bacterium RBG_13_52_11]|nr:MAG: AbrB family transcriptional regulator [Deltaproteobacteria bacterium RBG_13_52_11]
MVDKGENESCCMPMDGGIGSCKVESVISIDDRGQMVIPKSIRDMAKIRAGDKLAVISWEKGGEVCCISLIKVDNLAGMVKGLLGPLMKDILAG